MFLSFHTKLFKYTLTLNHTIRTFNDLESSAFKKKKKKRGGGEEKMLVTSILSFSNNVFNPIKYENNLFKYFYFVVCKRDQSKTLSFGKELSRLNNMWLNLEW